MCGLDYESMLNTHKKEENKEYIESLHKQKDFTKAMEGSKGALSEQSIQKYGTAIRRDARNWLDTIAFDVYECIHELARDGMSFIS